MTQINPEADGYNPDSTERAVTPQKTEITSNGVHDLAIDAYGKGDTKSGVALERAAAFLQDNPSAPGKYGFTQRAMEASLKRGEWSDETRQLAVELNTLERISDGRPPVSIEAAYEEMRKHAEAWREAKNTDGSKDGWLDQEGIALNYHVGSAKRGNIESTTFLLETVEGLLAHSGHLSESERGAQAYRDLRDALYRKRQELLKAENEKTKNDAESVARQGRIDQARGLVDTVVQENTRSRAEDIEARNQEAFDKLPPEQQALRRSMSRVLNALTMTSNEMGLARGQMSELSPVQVEALTHLFNQLSIKKVGISGADAVGELRDSLKMGVRRILSESEA